MHINSNICKYICIHNICIYLDLEEAAAEDPPGGLDARGARVEVLQEEHRRCPRQLKPAFIMRSHMISRRA